MKMINIMNSNRILIVMCSMGRGGAERVISLIANYLAIKQWEVYIALLHSNKVSYELNENIKIINLTFDVKYRSLKIHKWIKFLRRTVKYINPNVILSFAARVGILTHIACLGLNKDIIVSERNDPYGDGRSKLVDLLSYYFYPKSKAIIFQTKRASRYFEFLKLNNAYIIPNPISVSSYAKNGIKDKIVTVGRLEKQKNQKMLIEAFSKIANKFPKACLYIYGEGYLRKELNQHISDLNLSERVELKGEVTNIHEVISDASIFVLSSNYEGLSNALLEAMMMGLPCISTKCAGSDEYIDNGINGLLVNIGDVNEMAEAMEFMLSNREEAVKMGNKAKEVSIILEKRAILERWYQVILNYNN